jgi:hypothetical protein
MAFGPKRAPGRMVDAMSKGIPLTTTSTSSFKKSCESGQHINDGKSKHGESRSLPFTDGISSLAFSDINFFTVKLSIST